MDKMLKNVTYHIEDNIHIVILKTGTRMAIDETFDVIEYIIREEGGVENLQYIFDASNVNELPVMYTMQKAEKWQNAHFDLPNARTAIILSKSIFILTVINLLIQLFRRSSGEAKLFNAEEYDEAIDWLHDSMLPEE